MQLVDSFMQGDNSIYDISSLHDRCPSKLNHVINHWIKSNGSSLGKDLKENIKEASELVLRNPSCFINLLL
jgi:hypothetical protein